VHITAELEAAIEGLYSAFESYPLPMFTNPCPCCHSPIEADAKLGGWPTEVFPVVGPIKNAGALPFRFWKGGFLRKPALSFS
jgi:hypothetical protein